MVVNFEIVEKRLLNCGKALPRKKGNNLPEDRVMVCSGSDLRDPVIIFGKFLTPKRLPSLY